MLLILVLLFLLLIPIYYLYIQLNSHNLEEFYKLNRYRLPLITEEEVFSQAKTGDLLFLSGNTKGENVCKWFTKSIFSHVGLIFKEEDFSGESILYIIDCDLGQKAKDGVRVMKLKDKLERYKGYRIGGYKKIKGADLNQECVLSSVEKYKKVDFDHKILTWWVSEIPKIREIVKNKNTMFCSEFIAEIFMECGVMDRKSKAYSFSPENFNKMSKISDTHSFEETRFFEF